jgi:hypothetical protein
LRCLFSEDYIQDGKNLVNDTTMRFLVKRKMVRVIKITILHLNKLIITIYSIRFPYFLNISIGDRIVYSDDLLLGEFIVLMRPKELLVGTGISFLASIEYC